MSLAPGSYVGVYEILAPLGAGGIGEVYRARDPKLRRQVAIKVLPAAFGDDFERVAALSHPNILAIHDYGRDGDITYAVMELLDGHSLRELIDAGSIPRWRVVNCATQIAKGLEAAHARGIVHRDLKPENVFVSAANHVKILDFGLAAADARASRVSAYLSPEQARGDAVDHRSDIFSFGCLLYEMLCGKRAFDGLSSTDTLDDIRQRDPRAVATPATVPEPLVQIVARCLEKSPAARFQTMTDLLLALSAATDTRPAAPKSRWRIGAWSLKSGS
jgi:serine/threonine protein kinase